MNVIKTEGDKLKIIDMLNVYKYIFMYKLIIAAI